MLISFPIGMHLKELNYRKVKSPTVIGVIDMLLNWSPVGEKMRTSGKL